MESSRAKLTEQIEDLLKQLAGARRHGRDHHEAIHGKVITAVAALPKAGILEAFDAAVENYAALRKEAVYVLAELSDVPGADARIAQWLRSPDPDDRSWLLQTIGQKRLTRYAPVLNHMMAGDRDRFCRSCAILAAGQLQSQVNVPTLLSLAENEEAQFALDLAVAFSQFPREEFRPYLQKWFRLAKQSIHVRVHAAWGLGKLNDPAATQYLFHLVKTETNVRAAQAVCDIYGWPFEWNATSIKDVTKRIDDVLAEALRRAKQKTSSGKSRK